MSGQNKITPLVIFHQEVYFGEQTFETILEMISSSYLRFKCFPIESILHFYKEDLTMCFHLTKLIHDEYYDTLM